MLQRQLGHESITTTVDLYGHLVRADFDPLVAMSAGILATEHRPQLRLVE